MKQIGSNPSINKAVNTGGIRNVSTVGGTGGGAKKVEKQQSATESRPLVSTPAVTNEGGVQTVTKADGSVSKKAESGLTFASNSDGSKSLSMPGDQGGSFKIDPEGNVQVTSGEAKNVAFGQDENGTEMLNFQDKKGHQVFVDTNSMAYSVEKWSSVGDKNFTAQIFEPDGSQHVQVRGTHLKEGDYDKIATFSQNGELLANEGFSNLKIKNGKLEFDLGEGRASPDLPRALPGQPEPKKETNSPSTASQNAAPTALLAEQPLLLTGPDKPLLIEGPKADAKTEAPVKKEAPAGKEAPAADPAKAAKAEKKDRMESLRDVTSDFFNPDKNEEARFGRTHSGVIVRQDENTIAYALPTGDQFRADTDDNVVALGKNPRAVSPRITTEDDGRKILSYKDQSKNIYRLDMGSGDLEVSRADGKLQQKLISDGSEVISATSTHTTESREVVTSQHEAHFDPDGKLVSKTGFDNLKTGSKHLEYTLPDGKPTVRNLLMETNGKAEPPAKPFSFDPETQSLVDKILGKSTSAAEPKSAGEAKAAVGPNSVGPADPSKPPEMGLNGVSRQRLEDGTVKTTMPTGLTFIDGEEPKAFAADGSPLKILKTEHPSGNGSYMLTTRGKDNIGYTIVPDALDYIAEGKEGKVHQFLKADGMVTTSVTDGKREHVHHFNTTNYQHSGSPGVFADQRTPGQIYVADHPQNRTYELPVAYPLPPTPPGQQPPEFGPLNPNMSQPGVKPSMWDKVKNLFSGKPNQTQGGPSPGQGHHNQPPEFGGMPSSHYHYDPVADQMKSMQRMNNVMMGMNVATLGLNFLSVMAMPTMFYGGFGGMYGW